MAKILVTFLTASFLFSFEPLSARGLESVASADLVVVKRWLSAVATGDVPAFEKVTAVPFTFITTNERKKCEGAVKTGSLLRERLKCIRSAEELLVSDLSDDGVDQIRPLKEREAALDALSKKVTMPGRWVSAFLNGDGVAYSFMVLVSGAPGQERVIAFILDREFETG